MPSIQELTQSSSLIFSGTVVKLGASTVPIVPPRENLLVARVDRDLRVDSVLGDLRGHMITVSLVRPEELQVDQKAIFFTLSWIHGGGIAVREVAHLPMQAEKEVAAAVERLAEMHLRDRLQSAELVVLAEVTAIRQVREQIGGRNAPHWAMAVLRVESVLKGKAEEVYLLFPTSEDVRWINVPRFARKQRGVFVFHRNERRARPFVDEKALGVTPLTALDPADFQPESQLAEIKTLLADISGQGGLQ